MQKQSLKSCLCGQALDLPEGEVLTVCRCGSVWEIDNGGFWFSNLIIGFDPPAPKLKLNHYEKYMKQRKKAGRC